MNLKTRNKTKEGASSSKLHNQSLKRKNNAPSQLINKKKEQDKFSLYNQRLLNYLKNEKGKTEIVLGKETKNYFDKIYSIEEGIDEMSQDIANFDRIHTKDIINKLFFVSGDIQNNCFLGIKEKNDSSMIKMILTQYINQLKDTEYIKYWIKCCSIDEALTQWLNNITNQIEQLNNKGDHDGTISTLTQLDELIKIFKTRNNDSFSLIFSINYSTQKSFHISFISSSDSPQSLFSIIQYIKTKNKSTNSLLISYIISICSSQQKLNEITSIYEKNNQKEVPELSSGQTKILQTAKKSKTISKLSSYLTFNNGNNNEKLIFDLITENKELRIEIANLHIQLNSYKSLQKQIQQIPLITYESLANEIKTENEKLMKTNLELNKAYHNHLEIINSLSQELLNAESNVYTFDEKGNVFESSQNKISSNNRKYYQQFKESFMTFFSILSNNNNNENSNLPRDIRHLDILKEILNSYYCFMDTIIDDFILQKNSISLYQKYIQSSFLGIYYERIINELLNYCFYDYQKNKVYESLNEMLIKIINSFLSDTFSNNILNVEGIKKKLNQFERINIENITNNKRIWLNELSTYKRLFLSFKNQFYIDKSDVEKMKENMLNEIRENDNMSLLKNNNSNKNQFFGYIKNEESPPMLFDDEEIQS